MPEQEKKPEPEQKAQEPEWKLLGMTQGDWTKIAIGLVCTLIGIGIASWLNSSKPHLTVKASEIARFQGDKHNPGFASINITSDGSKEAEGVECKFTLNNVQEVKVSPEHLNADVAIKENRVTVSAPVLNPGESLSIAAYTSNAVGLPDRPDVSVRGKGVVGEADAPKPYVYLWGALGVVLGAVLTQISINYTYKRAYARGKKEVIEDLVKEVVQITESFKSRMREAEAPRADAKAKSLPDSSAP